MIDPIRCYSGKVRHMSQKVRACGEMQRTKMFRLFGLVVICLIGTSCVSTYQKRTVTTKEIKLIQPRAEISENDLLEVRISTFASGENADEDAKAKRVSREIRRAEGYYIATKLRDTMQKSGHWGPVRVIPAIKNNGEIAVSGEILESDGEILKLFLVVSDASGTNWYSKEYSGVVDQDRYETAEKQGSDPFQSLYNQMANDIAQKFNTLPKKRVYQIRQIAELKFAAEFAPDIYGGYLKKGKIVQKPTKNDFLGSLFSGTKSSKTNESKGTYKVIRLPSNDDPSFQRIQRIRARENQLVETLDAQYDGLAHNIQAAYTQWRTSRLTEMNAVRKAEKLESERAAKAVVTGLLGTALIVAGAQSNTNCPSCGTAGISVGSVVLAEAVREAIQLSETAGADRKLHQIALEELGESLASEVTPVVLEVEGEAVELTGSVEDKFRQWRVILKKLHEQEVGPLDKSSSKFGDSIGKHSLTG